MKSPHVQARIGELLFCFNELRVGIMNAALLGVRRYLLWFELASCRSVRMGSLPHRLGAMTQAKRRPLDRSRWVIGRPIRLVILLRLGLLGSGR